jgi:hypothetical protein
MCFFHESISCIATTDYTYIYSCVYVDVLELTFFVQVRQQEQHSYSFVLLQLVFSSIYDIHHTPSYRSPSFVN